MRVFIISYDQIVRGKNIKKETGHHIFALGAMEIQNCIQTIILNVKTVESDLFNRCNKNTYRRVNKTQIKH